jgi:hypothetical protein
MHFLRFGMFQDRFPMLIPVNLVHIPLFFRSRLYNLDPGDHGSRVDLGFLQDEGDYCSAYDFVCEAEKVVRVDSTAFATIRFPDHCFPGTRRSGKTSALSWYHTGPAIRDTLTRTTMHKRAMRSHSKSCAKQLLSLRVPPYHFQKISSVSTPGFILPGFQSDLTELTGCINPSQIYPSFPNISPQRSSYADRSVHQRSQASVQGSDSPWYRT